MDAYLPLPSVIGEWRVLHYFDHELTREQSTGSRTGNGIGHTLSTEYNRQRSALAADLYAADKAHNEIN
jgi:hypothetical protein